jgi:hypothetical protein
MKLTKQDLQKIIKAEVNKVLSNGEVDYRPVSDIIYSKLVDDESLIKDSIDMIGAWDKSKAQQFKSRLDSLIKEFSKAFVELEIEADSVAQSPE